jgi:phosphatidylglycerophosphate synthase
VSVADLLSLSRIPLGFVFILVANRPLAPLLVLALAGLTDVLDGPLARHALGDARHLPHRGDWLDPLCDKVFVGAVIVGIYLSVRPPLAFAALVLTRELLQTTFMVGVVGVGALRGRRFDYPYRAHPIGKITTVAQFASAFALMARQPAAWPLAGLTCALGVASAAIYLARARRVLTTA